MSEPSAPIAATIEFDAEGNQCVRFRIPAMSRARRRLVAILLWACERCGVKIG